MAEDLSASPREGGSPVPRAPPPSPECLAHTTDLSQFDFSALLLNNHKKSHQDPYNNSNSYHHQHSSGTAAYNHSSPPLSREPSGNTSPSWNGSGSFQSYSPFFLPSPEHHTDRLISDPPSPIGSNSVPPNRAGVLLASFHEAAHEPHPSNHVLSISLPVNGELQGPLFTQGRHEHSFVSVETGGFVHGVSVETNNDRRRKISLKRSHDQSQGEVWSNSYDQSWHHNNEVDVLQKRLCCASDVRDRESRYYNDHSHHRSPSPQRTRAYTHSGITSRPLASEFNRLSLTRAENNSISCVPQPGHAHQQNHAHQNQSLFQVSPYQGSHIGSHVIPQATATVGFVTTENHTPLDAPMDTGEMMNATPTSQMTKISITRAESIEYNLMDTGGHAQSSSNSNNSHKTFSFSLGSSNFNTDSLHPLGGGAYTQGTPLSRSPNDLFSHSL